MKVYIGILAILGFIFYQTNKNYEGESKLRSIRAETENIYQKNRNFNLFYDKPDTVIKEEIEIYIQNGIMLIEDFFGEAYNSIFNAYLFANRGLLDKHWQSEWQMPEFKSQCWMVASGTASRLDILTPRVWPDEACEHDSNDKNALEKLIIHELVHVYHGQNSPNPNFYGMDEVGWFVEGLAVYASGQFDNKRKERAKEAFQKSLVPKSLIDLWSGDYRYALAGSLVSFIDDKYGRNEIKQLMLFTNQNQILTRLNISEDKLFEDWHKYLFSEQPGSTH